MVTADTIFMINCIHDNDNDNDDENDDDDDDDDKCIDE